MRNKNKRRNKLVTQKPHICYCPHALSYNWFFLHSPATLSLRLQFEIQMHCIIMFSISSIKNDTKDKVLKIFFSESSINSDCKTFGKNDTGPGVINK